MNEPRTNREKSKAFLQDYLKESRGKNVKNYYTVKEASELLNVGIRTVQRYIHTGKLKAVKLGREFRIDKDSLESIANITDDTQPLDTKGLVKAGKELSEKEKRALMMSETQEIVNLSKNECPNTEDLIYYAIERAYNLGYMKATKQQTNKGRTKKKQAGNTPAFIMPRNILVSVYFYYRTQNQAKLKTFFSYY